MVINRSTETTVMTLERCIDGVNKDINNAVGCDLWWSQKDTYH